MTTALIHVPRPSGDEPFALTNGQKRLRQLVLNSVKSVHSKRNYAKALDDLFVFCANQPLSRELLMEYRTTMDHLGFVPDPSRILRGAANRLWTSLLYVEPTRELDSTCSVRYSRHVSMRQRSMTNRRSQA